MAEAKNGLLICRVGLCRREEPLGLLEPDLAHFTDGNTETPREEKHPACPPAGEPDRLLSPLCHTHCCVHWTGVTQVASLQLASHVIPVATAPLTPHTHLALPLCHPVFQKEKLRIQSRCSAGGGTADVRGPQGLCPYLCASVYLSKEQTRARSWGRCWHRYPLWGSSEGPATP